MEDHILHRRKVPNSIPGSSREGRGKRYDLKAASLHWQYWSGWINSLIQDKAASYDFSYIALNFQCSIQYFHQSVAVSAGKYRCMIQTRVLRLSICNVHHFYYYHYSRSYLEEISKLPTWASWGFEYSLQTSRMPTKYPYPLLVSHTWHSKFTVSSRNLRLPLWKTKLKLLTVRNAL